MSDKPTKIDLQIENHGTLFLFRPLSKKGKAWLQENVQSEDWQWLGDALSVEHRYAKGLTQIAFDDGLRIA